MSEPFIAEIRMFAGNYAPRGWALCDGQLLAVSQNDALFSLVGTLYGGDGRTTFGLPDLRGRIPIHQGTGPGLSTRRLGEHGGSEQATVSVAQLPAHRHSHFVIAGPGGRSDASAAFAAPARLPSGQGELPTFSSAGDLVPMAGDTIGATGGGQPHFNVQPFLCVNFIIALFGIYPSRN